MRTAVERIVNRFAPATGTMDVGYGGLGGVNTTNYLREHFGRIYGLCKDVNAVRRYTENHLSASNDRVIVGHYPEDMPPILKYDLLVLDPNIESNLKFWSVAGMKKAKEFLHEDGHLLTYVMLTDQYGDEDTQETIRSHRAEWWARQWDNIIRNHIVAMEREERRPEIMWALLKL
jgi:hypothetical protein